jgi:hypothetical protein
MLVHFSANLSIVLKRKILLNKDGKKYFDFEKEKRVTMN